ncbi:MAG: hypothetical protein GC191_08185 [Azospirillum sp.]|nr:hypothetical protein [Azospirillum sp.]
MTGGQWRCCCPPSPLAVPKCRPAMRRSMPPMTCRKTKTNPRPIMSVRLGAEITADLTPLSTALQSADAEFDNFATKASAAGQAAGEGLSAAEPPLSAFGASLNETAAKIAEFQAKLSGGAAFLAFQDQSDDAVSALDAVTKSTLAAMEAAGDLDRGVFAAVPAIGAFAKSFEDLEPSVRDAADAQRDFWGSADLVAEGAALRQQAADAVAAGNARLGASYAKMADDADAAAAKTAAVWGALADNVAHQQEALTPQFTQAQKLEYLSPTGNLDNHLWGDPFANDNGDILTGIVKRLDESQARIALWVQQAGETLSGLRPVTDAVGSAFDWLADQIAAVVAPSEDATKALTAVGEQSQALATLGSAAEDAATKVEALAPALTAVERGAADTGRALTTVGDAVPTGDFLDFAGIGDQIEGALQDLAAQSDLVTGSMAKLGAEAAVVGASVKTGLGALASSGPVGLVAAAGIGAFSAALVGAYGQALKAETEARALEQAIRTAGRQADVSASALQGYADTLSHTTLASRDGVLAAGEALLQFQSIAGDAFGETLRLADDMAAALGGDVVAQAGRLGAALEDPAKAVDTLTKAGVRFTDAEKETIRTLVDSGRQFEAQRVILQAVARDVGGSGENDRNGLTGQIAGLKTAWADFVALMFATEGPLAETAQAIVGTIANMVREINHQLDSSVSAQIERLQTERAVLAAQLQFNDFGLGHTGEIKTTAELRADAEKRLQEIDAELKPLQDRQRADALAADKAAEDARNAAVVQQRQVLSDRLTTLQADTEAKLAALSEDRIAKITADEEAQLRQIEGMRAEAAARGASAEELARYDALKLEVQQLALAERARLEPKAELEQAAQSEIAVTRSQIDANDKLIDSLASEIDLLHLSGRERAIETALRRLSADATDYQRQKVAELAAALYDEKEALQQQAAEARVLDQLRRQLADASANLTGADKAASDAVRQLGEDASDAAKKTADGLAREIYYRKQGQAEALKHRDAVEAYGDEIERLNDLLDHGAISQETYGRAAEDAWRRMLEASKDWEDGVTRGWLKYRDAALDSASQAERFLTDSLRASENAFTQFVRTGKVSFEDLTNSIIDDLLRIFYQRQIIAPIGDALFGSSSGSGGGLFGGLFSGIGEFFSGLFAKGGAFGADGNEIVYHATGDILDRPSWWLGADNRVNVGGEAGPEGILPLKRTASGELGVIAAGGGGGGGIGAGIGAINAADNRNTFFVTVDARGSTDPEATAALVDAAVARSLARIVPDIVRVSAAQAQAAVTDDWHRNGGRFR